MLGVGRAGWFAGATGEGTGRTTAWDTWDGTADTAWQDLVDETSTIVSTAVSPTSTEKNAYSLDTTKGLLTMHTGNGTVKPALIRFDTLDATSAQIQFYGGHNMLETAQLIPLEQDYFLISSTVDVFSIVPFKHESDSITMGSKISGLVDGNDSYGAIYDGSINSSSSHDITYVSGLMHDSATSVANNDPGTQAQYIHCFYQDTDGNTENQFFTQWRIPNLADLVSTPSAALEADNYNSSNPYNHNPLFKSGSDWAANSQDDQWARWFSRLYVGDRTFGFNHDNETSIIDHVALAWNRRERTNDNINSTGWHSRAYRQKVNADEDTFVTPFPLSIDSVNNNYNQYPIYKSDALTSTAKFNQKFMKACVDADGHNLYGVYSDEPATGDDSAQVSNELYITTARMPTDRADDQSNETADLSDFHQRAQIGDNYVRGVWADTIDDNSTITYLTDPFDAHAVSSINVSTGTGASEPATGVEHNYICMLQGKVAVIYRKDTQLYWSVFTVAKGATNEYPTLTRVIDGASLGTVQDSKNVAVITLGPGVACIICGSQYKIVKVPN